jgi:hypothetical protein
MPAGGGIHAINRVRLNPGWNLPYLNSTVGKPGMRLSI